MTSQISLCWNNFHQNMSSGMSTLLENEDLVDVTLVVEGRYQKAHKIVLSVNSPYFKELFKSIPYQHPIIFMKDVSYNTISDLLIFMYQGEVQVSERNLSSFVKTAEALHIKGLSGDENTEEIHLEKEWITVTEDGKIVGNETTEDVSMTEANEDEPQAGASAQGSTESEFDENPVQQMVEESEIQYRQNSVNSRPKKIAQSNPHSSKRQRLSTSTNESLTDEDRSQTEIVVFAEIHSEMEPYEQTQSITEEKGPNEAVVSEEIHIKMEPHDQTQSITEEKGPNEAVVSEEIHIKMEPHDQTQSITEEKGPNEAVVSEEIHIKMEPHDQTQSITEEKGPNEAVVSEEIHIKMEPHDQTQSITVTEDGERDGDSENEIVGYETTEDEPQAGSSAHGTGEERGTIEYLPGSKRTLMRYDNHIFYEHNLKGKKNKIWRCRNNTIKNSFDKKKCHVRAVLCGDQLRIIGSHNHNPGRKLKTKRRQFLILRNVTIIK